MGVLKNPKLELFAQGLAKGLSREKAYGDAGFAYKQRNAFRCLQLHPEVTERVKELQEEIADKVIVDAAYVLNQSVEIHRRCMQDIEPVLDKEGAPRVDDEGRPMFVFNAKDALKALELIGKHKSIQAFKESVDVNANLAIVISPEDAEA